MGHLVKLSTFRKVEFQEGEAPTLKTLRKLIDEGELAGKRIGAQYYVDLKQFHKTGNDLVDNVLAAS